MRRRQALVCGPSVADPDRQSGSRRTADQIEFLLEDGWFVTFAGSDAGRERYVRALRQKGVRTVADDEKLIEELVDASQFDLALIAFWYTAERYLPIIRRSSPQTRVVVDSIDLHFLRATRGAFLDGGSGSLALSDGEGSMFVRELNTYSAADAVLAVSEKEARAIDDFLARPGHTITIPDCEEADRSPLSFAERAGILFIGNFEHPPNVGAVEFLCEEIAPRIKSAILERHPINVVGNALDDSIRRICDRRVGVNPIGWVPSVHPYLNAARVSVVPLLYGAGTKRKLIQALRAGTPTVSTRVGVEGVGVTHGSEVLVADDARSFAASVERLVEDEPLWSRLANAGRSLTESAYSRATAQAQFRDAVAEILKRESSASTPSAPATATRERAPLPDAPRRGSRWQPNPPAKPRPIFIVGSPRSGTSVLTWALGQHPNIIPLEESDWLAKLGADLATSYDLATRRGDRSAFGAMEISRASLYSAIGSAVNELICSHRERYVERTTATEPLGPPSPAYLVARSPDEPKERWIDGTPEYSHSIVPIRRLFPNAVFIHLIRDVREVARSLVHFHAAGGARFNRQEAYAEWLRNVRACLAAEHAYGSAVVLRIRHADLVEAPEEVVRRCLKFVGEAYSAQCLDPLQARINSSYVPAEQQGLVADGVTAELREEAERLSDHLLSEESPAYGPAPDEQAELEAGYDALVPSLEEFFSGLAPRLASREPNRRESGEEVTLNVMRSEWDERARLNPMHYIASNKVIWDEDDFFSGGAWDVEQYVGSDLEAITNGREAKAMRMLEIGCGIGRMTRHLAGMFGEVHGVDVAPTMVAMGREKMAALANVHLHETSGMDLGMFTDDFFDFAFSYIVFQHVPFREAIVSYFREVHRTLKPGCLFKFQVQGAAIERPNTWVGVGFSSAEMQHHAEVIGFEPLREDGVGTQYYWHWWRRV